MQVDPQIDDGNSVLDAGPDSQKQLWEQRTDEGDGESAIVIKILTGANEQMKWLVIWSSNTKPPRRETAVTGEAERT